MARGYSRSFTVTLARSSNRWNLTFLVYKFASGPVNRNSRVSVFPGDLRFAGSLNRYPAIRTRLPGALILYAYVDADRQQGIAVHAPEYRISHSGSFGRKHHQK